MKNLVILSGAGISAESGIKTFRDSDGLWEGHDVTAVASISGWQKDPKQVLDFYNQRRRQLLNSKPNAAHQIIAELESSFHVSIVTQNIDDLHERAGSTHVIHLHGELLKAKSSVHPELVYPWHRDINIGDLAADHHQLRPDIVWFGEAVPQMDLAIEIVAQADILVIIGTSLQVYPAASLFNYRPASAELYYIDPKADSHQIENCHIISEVATKGMQQLKSKLLD